MHGFRTLFLTLCGLALATTVSAQTSVFSASYTGGSQIVDVLDPAIPLVIFQTTGIGTGSFDLTQYASQDIVNLATGAGNGKNRFLANNGDTLFGIFSVQVIPTATPGIVDLQGLTTFSGGTGMFTGASGFADLSGSATFTSQTTALVALNYRGSVTLVPEPGGMAMLAGLGISGATLLRRLRRKS